MIFLASDHGGFNVKEQVKLLLASSEAAYVDLGPRESTPDDDYPDYIIPLAERVAAEGAKGIIACRNGQGAAIAANKVPGIRAAVCWNEACAVSARTDDDTNILSLPADYLGPTQIESIVTAWLKTDFSGDDRHKRRIAKIDYYEHQTLKQ